MARTARPKVTDTPFKGRGVKTLSSKPKTEAKRTGNLRAVDRHLSSKRAAQNRNQKKAPKLSGSGMLHDHGGPHPIAHLGNSGAGKGQEAKAAAFREVARAV